jgi:hypothetical protein
LPLVIALALLIVCSCCSFLVGVVIGIELPGFFQPAPQQLEQQDQGASPDEPFLEEEPTPESHIWRVT